jgi:hypothetical protein
VSRTLRPAAALINRHFLIGNPPTGSNGHSEPSRGHDPGEQVAGMTGVDVTAGPDRLDDERLSRM